MNSGDRAKLRGLAMSLQPTTQIGKNGINDNLLQQINEQLEARELIKITVLPSSDVSAKDIIAELAKSCRAEAVQAIGSKVTLYRRSINKDAIHLL